MLPVWEHGGPGSVHKDPVTAGLVGGCVGDRAVGAGCCSAEAAAGALPPAPSGEAGLRDGAAPGDAASLPGTVRVSALAPRSPRGGDVLPPTPRAVRRCRERSGRDGLSEPPTGPGGDGAAPGRRGEAPAPAGTGLWG